jgi:hypothetical protein
VIHLLSIIRRLFNPITRLDVKTATEVMQQVADDADQAKRSWSH